MSEIISFKKDVSNKYGINAAIIISIIEQFGHSGCTVNYILKILPCLTLKTIYNHLTVLIEAGIIKKNKKFYVLTATI